VIGDTLVAELRRWGIPVSPQGGESPRILYVTVYPGSTEGGATGVAPFGAVTGGDSYPGHVLVNVPEGATLRFYLLFSGLRGVFVNCTDVKDIALGIRRVVAGEYWFPRWLMQQWLSSLRADPWDTSVPQLTDRERGIVRLVVAGAPTKRIASALEISPQTVRTHLYNIFKKTGVRSRVELVRLFDRVVFTAFPRG